MDIRDFECFVVLAEKLSFSQAAEQLYIEQSTLSKVISRLESHYGIAIFSRSKRNVSLTPAGAVLLKDAQAILSQYETSISHAKAFSKGLTGHISLGYCGGFERTVIPSVTRRVQSKYPDIQIDLHKKTYGELQTLLDSQGVDLSVTFIHGINITKGLKYEVLCEDHYVIALPYDHKFADRESVTMEELKDELFIIEKRTSANGAYNLAIEFCMEHGFIPHLASSNHSIESINDMIAAGQGVCIQTSLFENNYEHIKKVPISNIPHTKLVAIWNEKNDNYAIPVFVSELKEFFRKKLSVDE